MEIDKKLDTLMYEIKNLKNEKFQSEKNGIAKALTHIIEEIKHDLDTNCLEIDFDSIKQTKEDKKDELLVVCPNCGNVFDSNSTFDWLPDERGHPTVEFLQCPNCKVATVPMFSCGICPNEINCKLEEECGATLYFSFEKWKKY
jgi:uncharacterized C2H2 Zn-finger protein